MAIVGVWLKNSTVFFDNLAMSISVSVDYMQKEYPELAIDGEMQVNFALNTKLRDEKYPFTRLKWIGLFNPICIGPITSVSLIDWMSW